MARRRFISWGGPLLLVVAVAVALPAGLRVRRRSQASRAFEAAVAAYMFYDVEKAKRLFADVAVAYGDLPIGALAELKVAFLTYDEDGDLDRAEALLLRFCETHPQTVLHLPQTAQRFEYFGEVDLVAWFLLGKIAADRGRGTEARQWFERVVETGSRNPANYIVAESRSMLRGKARKHEGTEARRGMGKAQGGRR